jgi:hypothetical protein
VLLTIDSRQAMIGFRTPNGFRKLHRVSSR